MKKIIAVVCIISLFIIGCSNKTKDDKIWWIDNDFTKITEVWEYTKGQEDILVGVIDSGIDIHSDEIHDAIYTNLDEIPDNNIDDDGNGFVDDVNGWNFYDDDNQVYKNFAYDYHGTMIAGIIASHRYGIADKIKILPLRCFRGLEGDAQDIVKAIEYGYKQGVRIFNCSWDMSEYNHVLEGCMKKYKDAIFVCSAGKDSQNLDSKSGYPSSYGLPNIISVGGYDIDKTIYQYSGYGSQVDVFAPATHIYCVLPEDKYEFSEGTSFSVAITTGVIALAFSMDDDIEGSKIKERFSNCDNKLLDASIICGIK